MKTKLLVSSLLLATAAIVYAYPRAENEQTTPVKTAQVKNTQEKRPVVEVVFVLDTTGSMGGLIEAAKNNIWSIARTMASAQPRPDIRIGLVAYRDRGDAYVTRVVELSDDLDSMYASLMDFSADGGGDGPEAVNEALYAAVHNIRWSQDPAAYQVIFLVGDAQAHMDYPDDVKYPDTVKVANARGIIVNTIQAGDDPSTHTEWLQIAQLSQGAHFKVGQQGDAVAVATPFDADMARLSKELDDTRLFYGDEKAQARARGKTAATEKLNEGGSVGSLAQRAAFNASSSGAKNFLGDSELVNDVASGRVDLAAIDKSELPATLQELSTEEQRKVLMETKGKRDALSGDIAQLAQQRQQYIEDELSKDAKSEQSLDYQIFGAVKEQAAKKGLRYDSVPAH